MRRGMHRGIRRDHHHLGFPAENTDDLENSACSLILGGDAICGKTVFVKITETRIASLAVIASIVILAIKFVAWVTTGSSAVLCDALESIVNVVASLMTLGALRVATRPPDANHPYGHGRVEFVSAAVEGGMLIAAGLCIVVHSTGTFFSHSTPVENTGVGLVLVIIGGAVNLLLAWLMISIGRRNASSALIADGVHLLSDSITTVGVIVGLMLVRITGLNWIDPVVAIALGLLLAYMGWRVAGTSIGRLMDKQDDADINNLHALLRSHLPGGTATPTICSFHKVRCRHDGRMHWIDMHLQVPPDMSVTQSHAIASVIEERAIERLGGPGDATAHCEPCQRCSLAAPCTTSTS